MYIIEYLLFSYFSLSVVYTLFFSIAGKVARRKSTVLDDSSLCNKIAVFIPAYKEDQIIESVVKHMLDQSYPSSHFDIIVIADSFQPSTVDRLSRYPIRVIPVDFVKSTKTKSLNYAFDHIKDAYEIAVISDADNVLEKDFLLKINQIYNAGYRAIQGRRVAKNMSTSFAALDAISESINNHIFRKGFNAVGLSSALIGSGMAFNYEALREKLLAINAVGGFDKELQLSFLLEGKKILYVEDAIAFDEKIESSRDFENQRRRWLHSQFFYLKKYFVPGIKQLFRGNISYFNLAVLCNLFLPRLLNIGALLALSLAATLGKEVLVISPIYWYILSALYTSALLLAIPANLYNRKLLKTLYRLPSAFLVMLRSLVRTKGANKEFIHTTHTKTDIDNTISY